MAAENCQRQPVHCLQSAEKGTAVPASDPVQRLDADREWRLMHEQKSRGRHIRKRAHQPRQMRQDVAVALTGDGHIDTEEGQPIDGCPEMHRSRRINPGADGGKFGAHHLHIVTVARQQVDGKSSDRRLSATRR